MTTTPEPGDRLSRRYFAGLLGLGAVAAAVGTTVAAKAVAAVAEKAVAVGADVSAGVDATVATVWKVASDPQLSMVFSFVVEKNKAVWRKK